MGILNATPVVGPKTRSLQVLQEQGFAVPAFFPIDAATVQALWTELPSGSHERLHRLVTEIIQRLPAKAYAVRSSAVTEDTGHSAQAGQFHTEVNVAPTEVGTAIVEVMRQGQPKLVPDTNRLSIIVQVYIPADVSGILFTRNPLGGREMVIECHAGAGEAVVSGKVQPQRYAQLWDRSAPAKQPRLPVFVELVEIGKKIEQIFGGPQDIEWCLESNQLWIVQSRPITTYSDVAYLQAKALDEILAPLAQYYFEKTQLCEIAPRPTPITLDLLHQIYATGGPVDRVYQKFGLTYSPKDFLRVLGNELFVDRELELQTLLPGYTYFGGKELKPHSQGFRGLAQSHRNQKQLARIPLDPQAQYQAVVTQLQQELVPNPSLTDALKDFLSDYSLIFEINLLAEAAWQKALRVGSASALPLSRLKAPPLETSGWLGNALEISDQTPFQGRASGTTPESSPTAALSEQAMAADYAFVRELGRWLTVKHINRIRSAAKVRASALGLSEKLACFATLAELEQSDLDVASVQKRLEEYSKYASWELPSVLLSQLSERDTSQPLGVSPGHASGVIVDRAGLANVTEKSILFTTSLTPDLVQYFPKIAGILSERGGMLSHLAIMAREHHIPVIANASLDRLNLKIGDRVSIDGQSGRVARQTV